jgi:hypothetical protein
MLNKLGAQNINDLVQLGYKPGRLIDIWEMKYGRQATGCCMWCKGMIHPMRIMRKCGGIAGCYPVDTECFVVVNGTIYPGVQGMRELPHRQRAMMAGLVCQGCWVANGYRTVVI